MRCRCVSTVKKFIRANTTSSGYRHLPLKGKACDYPTLAINP
ncbi:MAG: hypothetical protein ACI4RP_09800 [Acutalibacteraceae bacterium]